VGIQSSSDAGGTETPASAPSDEAELVAGVRRGDERAFAELVRRYMRRAYAVGFRILRHREDAEDLVQETLLVALDRIDTLKAGQPFGPWLFRILINRGLNARAHRAIRAAEPMSETDHMASPAGVDIEQIEIDERFRIALAALPSRQRVIVEMFELEGFTTGEIASALGIASATVRWHLRKARSSLRTTLAPLHRAEETR
jgi:RNA polymerase sigma-70 factor (ECF subfamily)